MASDQNYLMIVKQLIQAGASLNLYDKVLRLQSHTVLKYDMDMDILL